MADLSGDDALRLDRQMCFPLYAAARKVVNLYTPLFKPLGITYTQYLVFLVLWEVEQLRVGDLCKKLYLDNGTLTPVLKKMEKEGYVTRSRDRVDERIVRIGLTEKGWDLRKQAEGIPEQVGDCLNLSDEEAVTLYGLLYKLLDRME